MTDIKNALAQLRAARNGDDPQTVEGTGAAVAEPLQAAAPGVAAAGAAEGEAEGPPTVRGEIKTLAGRVPLPLHRELTRALLDAAEELRVSKINVDEALEAAMRVVLRDPQAIQLWYAQLREVRRERREG